MNWFTKSYVAATSDLKKTDLVANWGGCEHVEADTKSLHIVSYENDPWGREGYCLCKECWDKCQEEEEDKEVFCNDCKTKVKKKDSITWTWYDFYAPSGDTPLVICKACATKETHKRRTQKDEADRKAEFGDHDNDYCD